MRSVALPLGGVRVDRSMVGARGLCLGKQCGLLDRHAAWFLSPFFLPYECSGMTGQKPPASEKNTGAQADAYWFFAGA